LPNLKLVTIIGMSLPNLDMAAATDHGVIVAHSNFANPIYAGIFNATPELTWGLMIAVVRHFDLASRRMRAGGWQSTVGTILAGRTLGLLGLGRIGKRMAAYGRAFDMPVIAWSQNLTDLIAALRAGRIAGAGIDVYDVEPPAADHPFRAMDNVTVTPHLLRLA
jgi:D-3-phosphoglycerate dehydrogenase